MQNLMNLDEQDYSDILVTKIVKVTENPIKIKANGKATMLSTLSIVLAETIFHPQARGQPINKGTINHVPVLAVNLEKALANEACPFIYHYLDPRQIRNKRFDIGQRVTLRLQKTIL